jgi:hypothetical protein
VSSNIPPGFYRERTEEEMYARPTAHVGCGSHWIGPDLFCPGCGEKAPERIPDMPRTCWSCDDIIDESGPGGCREHSPEDYDD